MTRRKQLTITVDKEILKKFKRYCQDNDINMSKRIERYMRGELKKIKKK